MCIRDRRKRPERSGQHTQYNARIGMHSKPSRTPGNVSHTVLYDAVFLPHGTACSNFNCAGEARATHRKHYYILAVQLLRIRTREHPVDIDRQTTPSRNPNGARWLGAPTYPTVPTTQSVICGVGRLGSRRVRLGALCVMCYLVDSVVRERVRIAGI